jgi:regulator of RNase E activity RraA
MKFYDPKPLSEATRALLKDTSTATLTSVLFKHGLKSVFMNGPKALNPAAGRMVGPAYTIRMVPMREDFGSNAEINVRPDYPQRKAIEETPAGGVLCFDCRGELRAGTVGEILVERLRVRGVAGLCVDGAVRDGAALAAQGLPVFCASVTAPPSMTHHVAFDAQLAVVCGGVTVFPGDILVGDGDGVVVIPNNTVDAIAKEAAEKERQEQYIFQRIAGGDAVTGVYPPNEKTLADYAAWKKQQGR